MHYQILTRWSHVLIGDLTISWGWIAIHRNGTSLFDSKTVARHIGDNDIRNKFQYLLSLLVSNWPSVGVTGKLGLIDILESNWASFGVTGKAGLSDVLISNWPSFGVTGKAGLCDALVSTWPSFGVTGNAGLSDVLVSDWPSLGVTGNVGLSDMDTEEGTNGTVLTPKFGRLIDVERVDGVCSMELPRWDERPEVEVRVMSGCSTLLSEWAGRYPSVERPDNDCSVGFTVWDARPIDPACPEVGCSWIVLNDCYI